MYNSMFILYISAPRSIAFSIDLDSNASKNLMPGKLPPRLQVSSLGRTIWYYSYHSFQFLHSFSSLSSYLSYCLLLLLFLLFLVFCWCCHCFACFFSFWWCCSSFSCSFILLHLLLLLPLHLILIYYKSRRKHIKGKRKELYFKTSERWTKRKGSTLMS